MPSEPRAVDETLDDESAPIIAAPGATAPPTEPSRPKSSEKLPVSRPPSGPMLSAPTGEASPVSVPRERTPVPRTAPGDPYLPPTNPRELPTAPASRTPQAGPQARTAKPVSGVDTTMNDEPVRRRRSRTAALILFCFLLGAALAAGAAYRMGLIGPAAVAGTRDEQVRRAEDALKHKKWDTPPGDNVRDLTTEGLARWPGDARLLETRVRAADELVKEALGAKFAGDLTRALHLARLARELDATDTTAMHLVDELEQAVGQVAPTISASTAAPLAKPPSPPVTTVRPLPPPVPLTTNMRAVLDASNTKPRVGQQVELVAKVVGPKDSAPKNTPEDAHFNIVGPGGAATRLPATADGSGIYRATFTFLEAGKYDVTFNAKADGAAVHATRTINAGAGAPAPSGDTPPPPAPSGKWL
jgi:serine/threonine-protein kinase